MARPWIPGFLAAVLAAAMALAGCSKAGAPSPAIAPEGQDPAAATFAKAAIRVFSGDWIDYDIPVTEAFSGQDLEILRRNLPSLITMVEDALGTGSVWGAKLAGHFKVSKVVPLLRHHLLTPQRTYGWEGPDYSKPESYLLDEQYQYSMAYLQAIEDISGKPIHQAVNLTPSEIEVLDTHARNSESEYCHWAIWLKNKLHLRGPAE